VDALPLPRLGTLASVLRSEPSLAHRHREPELMDDPALAPGEHEAALRGLARINRVTAVARLAWEAVERLARERPEAPLRVLDVATGAGDLPLALARRARTRGVELDLAACDLSPRAVARVRAAAAAAGVRVDVFEHDVLRDALPAGFDVVTCSLFLHHLSDEQGAALLRAMAAAGRLVVVQDLLRTRAGLVLAALGSRLLTRSRVVHVDAVLSVRAAYSLDEARGLAARAGLRDARVTRRWPGRLVLEWSRP